MSVPVAPVVVLYVSSGSAARLHAPANSYSDPYDSSLIAAGTLFSPAVSRPV